MTRINLVPVEELYDQHLKAEYREMPMVPAALNRTLNSKKGLILQRIPQKYKLNDHHVYFFYNKGKFLHKRYNELIHEMKRRGWNPDPNRILNVQIFKDNDLYNDWHPCNDEIQINRERIQSRIDLKPNWYIKTPPKEE